MQIDVPAEVVSAASTTNEAAKILDAILTGLKLELK